MNPAQPFTSHVAVRDGRIVGAGSLQELEGWGPYTLDERFAEKIIMPGLVEGHSHTMEGMLWRHHYCGFFDRTDPDGLQHPGLNSIDRVVEKLQLVEASLTDPAAPLSGWGIDPIYFDNRRITRHDLDKISGNRPIGILHASVHIMNVNTRALEMAGWFCQGMDHPGIPLGEDGLPTGELKGPDVMTPVGVHIGFSRDFLDCDAQGLREFSRLCVRQGVTTATDLASRMQEDSVETSRQLTAEPDFPVRIVALKFNHGHTPEELVTRAMELKQQTTDRYRTGMIKIVADGSIQGFSARLNFPGYYNNAPNGLWYIAPEQLLQIYQLSLKQQIQVHTHTNGDEATDLVLDMMEQALRASPAFDHRFTIQHAQLANAAQFRRIASLGLCVNLFANHHYYWGDEHYRLSVGPERAERMNACRTALQNNVPMAIHSDAPITPLGPLFTAWNAVARKTCSGRTQGEYERITVNEALHAITIGAAYTLKLDGEIGSIEAGKRADFAVLEEEPEQADALENMKIWGTVQDGRIFKASDI
ncbi:MAG: amidohydrolase [Granulosicoccus sp.]